MGRFLTTRKVVCLVVPMIIVVSSFAMVGCVLGWEWPMFRGNPSHSGYSASSAPHENYVLWSYETGDQVRSSPAVAHDMVFIGSLDHKVYALNATTGDLVWSYETGWKVWSSPAVAHGMVFIGSLDHKVYALNAFTGELVWSYETGGNVDSSPAVADGMVFIGSTNGKVYALDESTGALVWSYTTGSQVRSSPAVADGVVFIGSQDYRVYAFGVSQRVVVPLDIEVDVGSIHFRGEIAEFYVLTTLDGYAVDSTIARALLYYSNGTVKTTLHALVTRIAPGLYRIPYTIPADAPEGTYTLVVKALYITNVIVAHGVSFKSFQLSPTLTRWNAWLIEIEDGVATIQTDITTIKTNLNTINATISEIQGNIAAIETDIGTIKTDVNTINSKIITINGTLVTINSTIGSIQQDISTINGKIAAINGTLVTIETDIGTIKTDIDDIQLKVVAINGDIATIQTTLGTINGTITSIQGDIATIQTDIGAIKTILEEWTGGVTGSIITPEGTFRILVLTTSALEGPIAFSDNVVAITVSGPSGTPGTTNIVIPKQLLVGIESSINDIFVTLDDEQVVFTYTEHPKTYVLQITYTHSTHVIKVYLTGPPPAPFPAWTIALIVLIAAVATSVTFYTLKTRKPQVAKTK